MQRDFGHYKPLIGPTGPPHVPDSQWDVPQPSVLGTRPASHHSVTAAHPLWHGRQGKKRPKLPLWTAQMVCACET